MAVMHAHGKRITCRNMSLDADRARVFAVTRWYQELSVARVILLMGGTASAGCMEYVTP